MIFYIVQNSWSVAIFTTKSRHISLNPTKSHWISPNLIESNWMSSNVPNLNEFHQSSPNLTESHEILPYLTDYQQIWANLIESHQISAYLPKQNVSRTSCGTILQGGNGFFKTQHHIWYGLRLRLMQSDTKIEKSTFFVMNKVTITPWGMISMLKRH